VSGVGDTVRYKHRYSWFYGTDLDAVLRERGVTTLIVVGATTSVCVDSTVRDAVFRDFHCLVLEDCTAEPIGATWRGPTTTPHCSRSSCSSRT